MSTWAVFGMTRSRAREMALKRTRWEVQMTEAQYMDAVEKHTAQIMEGTDVVMLSEKFDAPSHAEAFLEIAARQPSRDLCIRAHVKVADRNRLTGKPVMKWMRYDRVLKQTG